MLLPPQTPFCPLPSPLPLSPLSGCVRRGGSSDGTAATAVIRDGPDNQTTKTRYGTASAAALAATEATEEEEYNRVMVPTPNAAWTTPSSAWQTGSSSARSS